MPDLCVSNLCVLHDGEYAPLSQLNQGISSGRSGAPTYVPLTAVQPRSNSSLDSRNHDGLAPCANHGTQSPCCHTITWLDDAVGKLGPA